MRESRLARSLANSNLMSDKSAAQRFCLLDDQTPPIFHDFQRKAGELKPIFDNSS